MNDNLSYSPAGYALTKQFEGLSLKAYQDSGGVWTIGYGHTVGVREGDVITQDHANALLSIDLGWAQDVVSDSVNVDLTDSQFWALTDFVFNVGPKAFLDSTLLRKLNAGDYAGAADEFLRWNHAGGKVLNGLTKRRQAEAKLFKGEEA